MAILLNRVDMERIFLENRQLRLDNLIQKAEGWLLENKEEEFKELLSVIRSLAEKGQPTTFVVLSKDESNYLHYLKLYFSNLGYSYEIEVRGSNHLAFKPIWGIKDPHHDTIS